MTVDIRKPLKQASRYLLEARDVGLNEADTVVRLRKFFEEVLGYDRLHDISSEAQMKYKYVDLCLKIDGRVCLLVEAKAAGQKLRERQIEQAERYASENNYQWVVLTNGVDWNLYHLTFEEGIEYQCAFAVSLGDEEGFEEAANKLALLHKHALSRGDLETFWEKATALGPGSIGKALFQDTIIMLLRREIRRQTGILIDPEDLANAVHEMLSIEAREEIGPLRIHKHHKSKKQKATPQDSPETDAQAQPVSPDTTPEPKGGT
jgi:hypothetical protein